MVDRDLLAQCQAGSDAAFRALYYRTMPRVRGWVARLLGPDGAVADVVQDVFVQVHRSIGAFRGESAFSTWLYRLTLNVATSHLRHAGRDRVAEAPERDSGVDGEQRLQAREDLRRLYLALDALPAEKRQVFVLYEIEGLTLQEIADLLGTGIPTVAARLRRARLALVEFFSGIAARMRAQRRGS
jgi:RNA polymerase sigma-70 factor (ECF subfamily)